VYLTPVTFHDDGWFTAGNDGTTDFTYEIPGDFKQIRKDIYTFKNTDWNIDWCYMRDRNPMNYNLSADAAVLHGTDITLEDVDSPTFIGMRQIDFDMELSCKVELEVNTCNTTHDAIDGKNNCSELGKSINADKSPRTPEAGITIFMCEDEHYDIAIIANDTENAGLAYSYSAVLKLNIGGIKHTANVVPISSPSATLIVRSDSMTYKFYVKDGETETYLGSGHSKYLTSEVSSGFTGVVMGLYAIGECEGRFEEYRCVYNDAQLC
jgi:alpha-N-arabinofuranosidase